MKINMEVYKFHSDKELLLEMSASITLYSDQLTLINNSIVTTSFMTQHHSFFGYSTSFHKFQ